MISYSCLSTEIMNRRTQRKRIYSWLGKAIRIDKQLQISHYRGLDIKDGKHDTEVHIFPGEFILVEGENVDQVSVARLEKLYENGTQEKHAVVEWFSHIAEIPLSQQMSLGQEDSREIFLNEKADWNTDICVTSIISKIMVVPLTPYEALPSVPKGEEIFFIRKSWDGKKLKPLPPSLLAELKDSVKMKTKDLSLTTEYHLASSHAIHSPKVETKKVAQSTKNSKNGITEIESRHSASRSSLSKQRHSQRVGNGSGTPGAKKKLQLNSPRKSPRGTFAKQDKADLLDNDFTEPVERSVLKRKVTFNGIKGSPPKISCDSDEEDLFLDIRPLEDHSEGKNRHLSPFRRIQGFTGTSAMKYSTTDLDEGHESETKSPALTPRLRRKCAEVTATRIAKQLCVLNEAGEKDKEENYFPFLEGSDCSSSDEEDTEVLCTPKKQVRSTPKLSRKPSDRKPAKNPSKTTEPRIPQTPRNATPRIRRRTQIAENPANALEEARIRLHVSAVPQSLPCREKEFQDIYSFIESKLIDGNGGCMYISGVPGTGKTATVHEAIRSLQQAAEKDELPSFQFIEINGMKLTDPHQAYVQILKLMTGQKATAIHAAALLEKMFCGPGSKRKTVILVVDELDLLWTRKQNVMYNLFDWPTQKNSKLIVLAIANTMDLPERIMMNRVTSRLGLTRMSFQPYTYKELQQIISARVGELTAFEEDAIQLVSRKVAALSGDARRCLDICRRATEICELASQKSSPGLVSTLHVIEAMDEMFSSPYINTIRNASLQEQIFLKATIAEFRRLGLEEATVQQIFHQHVALCRIEGLQTPTISDIMAISSRLGTCRLLLLESSSKYLHMRIRLNVSQDDVMYALKEE
ncbi:origin recognition complex subunit 1 isoform X2 [Varanus komodoensis]|uniref:origin recognition complex subunit 1 isoform X2 n=1 Tax=Varanus komodoensis TaxID=61221 RepID=UPI001CF79315|nr:origin recognition complex subunit 1 isoform X2 [Varanus komodoensis]